MLYDLTEAVNRAELMEIIHLGSYRMHYDLILPQTCFLLTPKSDIEMTQYLSYQNSLDRGPSHSETAYSCSTFSSTKTKLYVLKSINMIKKHVPVLTLTKSMALSFLQNNHNETIIVFSFKLKEIIYMINSYF